MQISEKERKSNAETLTFYQQPQLKTENVPCRKVPGYTHAHERVKVYVLFGGGTSERQVSLMSGTNVWLRLREYPEYDVEPLLLEPTPIGCQLDKTYVWHLPYAAVLRHTVEEVLAATNQDAAKVLGMIDTDMGFVFTCQSKICSSSGNSIY